MYELGDVDKITIKFTFKDGRTERAVFNHPDVVLGEIDHAVGSYGGYDGLGLGYMDRHEPSPEVAEHHTHGLKWYPLVFDLRILHKGIVRITKRKPDTL